MAVEVGLFHHRTMVVPWPQEVRPHLQPPSRAIRRAKRLALFCAGMVVALWANPWAMIPALAAEALGPPGPPASGMGILAGIGMATFGPGGAGSMIVQLMLIAVVSWLCYYVAQAAGNGQIASMIQITGVFSCIAIVAGVAYHAIEGVAHFFG